MNFETCFFVKIGKWQRDCQNYHCSNHQKTNTPTKLCKTIGYKMFWEIKIMDHVLIWDNLRYTTVGCKTGLLNISIVINTFL